MNQAVGSEPNFLKIFLAKFSRNQHGKLFVFYILDCVYIWGLIVEICILIFFF